MKKFIAWIRENYLLLTILLTSAVFRFWELGTLPPGLHPDEAANGLDIISMIEKGKFAVVYDTNGPREALFFYFQAIFVYIGKVSHWAFLNFTPLSLRVAPVIIGIVTVWAIYLLGKELFNRNVGLLASAALAVSAWHIQFSRNGFRAIMAPLALIFIFYFFIKAYRSSKLRDFVLTGVFLGLGFYTYLSIRMVPLIFMALLIFIFVTDRGFIKKNLKNIGWMSLAFFGVMIPMFIHFYYVPADILGRASTSIFNPELNGGSPIKALFSNIYKTMLMFNFKGDANWRHNVAALPMLDILTGILFWVGMVWTFIKFNKIEYFLLVMWFGAMSLPEVLTAEGIPHALRMVGTIPVVFLWIAIGANLIIERVKAKYALLVGILVILIVSGALSYQKYFITFVKSGLSGDAYAEDMVGIANDINKARPDRKNILVVGEYGTKTIEYITHATDNKYERYEVRDVSRSLRLPARNYKVFVQADWINDAKYNLLASGLRGMLTPVKSSIDGRVLYYVYEKN